MIKIKGLSSIGAWCRLVVTLSAWPVKSVVASFVWLFHLGLNHIVENHLFVGSYMATSAPARAMHPLLPISWCGAADANGATIELLDVSIRWKIHGFEGNHVQGILCLEKWRSDQLHRLRYHGNHSIRDPETGNASKGEVVHGGIYLPVEVDCNIQTKKFATIKSRKKFYGIRLDFGANVDGLDFVQLAIPMGEHANSLALAMEFHSAVEGALGVVDDSSESSALPLESTD